MQMPTLLRLSRVSLPGRLIELKKETQESFLHNIFFNASLLAGF